jgi:hypothetical protein
LPLSKRVNLAAVRHALAQERLKTRSVPFNPKIGLKFAPRVTCAECSGKGERSEQDLRQLYAVYTKTAEKAQGDYDKRERTVHAAFKKLTPKEVKAIAGI